MSVISGIGGAGAAAPQSGSRSTIVGQGVGSSLDKDSATITNTLSQLNRAFKDSFMKLNAAVSSVQVSKSALEDLLKITNQLIVIAEKASSENLSEGERQRIDIDFQKNIRRFRKILRTTKEEGVNLLNKDELNSAMKRAGIELEQSEELAKTLKSIAGLDKILGFEKVRSRDVTVDEIVRRNRQVNRVNDKTITVGDTTFQENVPYSLPATPEFVISADLNGNSIQDLIVAGSSPGVAQVLTGNGDGTFALGDSFQLGTTPTKIALLDFDSDSINDLVSLDTGSGTISVLRGNSDGSFNARTSYQAGTNPTNWYIGDLDGDGIKDIATLSSSTNTFSVLTGNLDGSFSAPVSFTAPANSSSIIGTDIDGNGSRDILITSATGNSITTFINNGVGTFTEGTSFSTNSGPQDIKIHDVNKDGLRDIITVNQDSVSIIISNGDGSYKASLSFAITSGGESIQILDYDKDSNFDLLIGSGSGPNPGVLQLLRGNGDGTFKSAITYDAGTSVTSFTVVDFNNDGALDIATTDTESGALRILIANGSEQGQFEFVGTGTFLKETEGGGTTIIGDGTFIPDTTVVEVSTDGTFKNNFSNEIKNEGTFSIATTTGIHLATSFSSAVGDLNNDGLDDFILLGSEELGVMLSNGDGTFKVGSQSIVTNDEGFGGSIDLMDLDGDGNLDAIYSDPFLGFFIAKGNGDGTFKTATQHNFFTGGRLSFADLNNDGIIDMASFGRVMLSNSDGSYKSQVNIGAGTGDQIIGDFNSDGILDILSSNNGTSVRLSIGNGNGTFKAFTTVANTSGTAASRLGLVDLNENGNLDFVLTTNTSIFTFFGNGNGTFARGSSYASNGAGISILETTNGLSLISSGAGNYIRVLTANSDGSFKASVSYATPFNSFVIRQGDFNGNGVFDIAMSSSSSVAILTGNSDLQRPQPNNTIESPTKVSLIDIDGDEILDLVTANYGANGSGSTISIQLGNGDGTFRAATTFDVGTSPVDFAIFDAGNNGTLDALVLSEGPGMIVLGDFKNGSTYDTTDSATRVELIDLNGNNILDLVTIDPGAGGTGSTISVQMGNGDGTFKAAVSFAAGTNPLDLAIFDANNDGSFDALI
ncbi:MAG TPA: VCBS repeat-containing protein, partial [Oligoflexia bacterium]|nr:VCBS repeat-containing protein [Oligoflexia bacterium]